ncbi:MAG: hypothetical protein L3J52_01160 [Proteobacteria bacterium]|nr:hypothetical protein [Pseudomonadota bacterium]
MTDGSGGETSSQQQTSYCSDLLKLEQNSYENAQSSNNDSGNAQLSSGADGSGEQNVIDFCLNQPLD